MKTILITGGAGFVGHHFIEHFLQKTDYNIIVLDKLTYASSGWDRLRDIEAFQVDRVKEIACNLAEPLSEGVIQEIGEVDYVLHIAAESHVDRSITDPVPFIMSNVLGTQHILDFAGKLNNLKCFFYFSTDEVFGSAPEGVFHKEDDQHNPANPYAAAKSGGEMLVKAWGNTNKKPWIITRSMNIIGERQHPEKFIPMVINSVLDGKEVTIHANAEKTQAGVRQYIHARNVANGYQFIIDKLEDPTVFGEGFLNQEFHITGEQEVNNLELAEMIADILQRPLKHTMVDFHSSRPGHDLRYALNGTKMKDLGWEPPLTFRESLKNVIDWSLENPKWLGRDDA